MLSSVGSFYNNSAWIRICCNITENIEGETLYLYPFDTNEQREQGELMITNGDIRLNMGDLGMIINPTQITMTDGGNSVTGFTGSFCYSLYMMNQIHLEKNMEKVSVKKWNHI